jgi:hypothetical protein
MSYETVCLRYLHNLQDITDEFINKVLNFSTYLIQILLCVLIFIVFV